MQGVVGICIQAVNDHDATESQHVVVAGVKQGALPVQWTNL